MALPTECPLCKGTDLHRERPTVFEGSVMIEADCENCNATWEEWYEFDEITDIEPEP